jgi:hypothetical protein
MGLALQQPAIAIQTVLSDSDSAVGLSVLNFVNFFGGTVFITVSQSLLQGQLQTKITKFVPDIDIHQLTNSGATGLKSLVPADKMAVVLGAYNDSMKAIWYLALGMACAAFLLSFGFEWKTVQTDKKKPSEHRSENYVAV